MGATGKMTGTAAAAAADVNKAVEKIAKRRTLLRVETAQGKVHIIMLWHQRNHLNKFPLRH